jgi:hypothetical protein
MVYTPAQMLTVEAFLDQYCDRPRYELADGKLIDRSLTRSHETVGGKLATQIGSLLVSRSSQRLPCVSCKGKSM